MGVLIASLVLQIIILIFFAVQGFLLDVDNNAAGFILGTNQRQRPRALGLNVSVALLTVVIFIFHVVVVTVFSGDSTVEN